MQIEELLCDALDYVLNLLVCVYTWNIGEDILILSEMLDVSYFLPAFASVYIYGFFLLLYTVDFFFNRLL